MCGYKAFYKNQVIEVYASSSYQAQCEAAANLRVHPSKRHLITVVLCERDNGEVITHSPSEF